jgi:nicotinamidase/pyrazinamidase
VNELIDSGDFDFVVATRDWHPANHASFREQGGPWPPHCVQNTHGAELSPALRRDKVDVIVDAGYLPDLQGYSGFENTDLEELLRRHDIEQITVVGLATDYCVKETAADALREGFDVTIDRGGIRGIDVEPGDSERALEELQAAGAHLS